MHAPQKVGGDKKTAGGRSEQVAILSFLNSLWKMSENVTHLSCVTASTASGDGEDTEKD